MKLKYYFKITHKYIRNKLLILFIFIYFLLFLLFIFILFIIFFLNTYIYIDRQNSVNFYTKYHHVQYLQTIQIFYFQLYKSVDLQQFLYFFNNFFYFLKFYFECDLIL